MTSYHQSNDTTTHQSTETVTLPAKRTFDLEIEREPRGQYPYRVPFRVSCREMPELTVNVRESHDAADVMRAIRKAVVEHFLGQVEITVIQKDTIR